MQSLIQARKLESYLEHHRKFHFGIYAMSGIPLLVETIENMWLRCGPVLSFVIPEYVVLLKGWDHHTAALKAIVAGDAERAGSRDRRRHHRSRALPRRPRRHDRAVASAGDRVGWVSRRRNPPPVEQLEMVGYAALTHLRFILVSA